MRLAARDGLSCNEVQQNHVKAGDKLFPFRRRWNSNITNFMLLPRSFVRLLALRNTILSLCNI